MTVENDNGTPRINGLAAMTFFEHEVEMFKKNKEYRRTLTAMAALLITSNLAWFIFTKKH